MDDNQIWDFEDSLWRADEAHYRESIDPACLMVTAMPPYAMIGEEAAARVAATPRWTEVKFSNTIVSRPSEGLIVIAYRALATRQGTEAYDARCTSTYRKGDGGEWIVVQHQQSPVLAD